MERKNVTTPKFIDNRLFQFSNDWRNAPLWGVLLENCGWFRLALVRQTSAGMRPDMRFVRVAHRSELVEIA